MSDNQLDFELMREHFKIKFNTQEEGGSLGYASQIDANTFINYLFHFNTLVQEINKEIAPNRKISVKINALSKGSFLVDIELQSAFDIVKQLVLSVAGRADLSSIMSILSGLITIKQFLGGKKPENIESIGDKVTVHSQGGSVTVNYNTYKIYTNNQTVSEALEKQFETLEADENINNVAILDEAENEIVKVDREDFDSVSSPNEMVENPVEPDYDHNAMLNIVRLSFDPKLKSDFFYKCNKITAYVKHKGFYEKIDSGESFSKGDTLEVELKILKQFDETVDTSIIKGYEVIEVKRHIPRGGKSQLQIELY